MTTHRLFHTLVACCLLAGCADGDTPTDDTPVDTPVEASCDDADIDGVCDDADRCRGDDATGDADVDGVCNDLDLCRGDDATGDSDVDGVCNDVDQCIGDDAVGDLDLDGRCEDQDLCAGDDATGDSDVDGICNDRDQCEGDDRTGDTDGDGRCDAIDLCVGTDVTGDTDADGVCDDVDLCDGDDAFGDADTDGVCEDLDQCDGDDATGDADADGVCGDLDVCFGDNASGDDDADGVCEDVDRCLGDDATGDADSDGICDDGDACWGDDAAGDADASGTCDDVPTWFASVALYTRSTLEPTVPSFLLVDDLDGDGADELVTNHLNQRRQTYYRWDGAALVDYADRRPGDKPRDILVVDLDGDGLLDIVGRNEASQSLTVVQQTGVDVFQQVYRGLGSTNALAWLPPTALTEGTVLAMGGNPLEVRVHPVQAGQLLDASTTFELPAVNGSRLAMAVLDVDGDGRDDLVHNAGSSRRAIAWLAHDGVDLATTDAEIVTDIDARQLQVADFGQGPQLFCVDTHTPTLVTQGSWTTEVLPGRWDDIVAGDLDGDGDADLIGYDGDLDALQWLENGDQGWVGPFTLSTHAPTVSGIAVGDLTGDGALDVVVKDAVAVGVAVFVNPFVPVR